MHASENSYSAIPRNELEDVTPAIFQNVNLAAIFNDVQWKIATKDQWQRTFNHLWPEKGVRKHGRLQNYPQAAYYGLWETMTSRMADDTAKEARRSLWRLFNSLEWAPCAGSERIWETKSNSTSFKGKDGNPSRSPAPRIFMRSNAPTWNIERPRDVLDE